MADRFWKSMRQRQKKPILDKLYRRLRDLDHSQVDERMAVILNAVLQLESQGEGNLSAAEAVLTVGYSSVWCWRTSPSDQTSDKDRNSA